ncbi:MAG: dihydroorotase [Bacteroidota bacterium]
MQRILIKGGTLINRGQRQTADLLIENGRIAEIAAQIDKPVDRVIEAKGKWVLPGIIDDQVHFREPGLTHKAEIYTEAKAAVAGGTTSFMEMPNTKPPAVTQEKLEEKYVRAAEVSLANYSFFMGASNNNLEEVLKTDPRTVCGVKIFMGSSTGNMLVDEPKVLDALFRECKMLIATHCEDEATIRANAAKAKEQYGEEVPIEMHPVIRNVEGCYKSSSFAVELAKKYGTRLHILHISTKDELALFEPGPIANKHITAEVCVHHLYFNADDYATKGTQVKCNPAVKGEEHRSALMPALLEDRLDIIATDHAPHTWEEKQGTYFKAPSGVPLVQHSLNVMLEFYQRGEITPERIVEKMSHAPAECFHIEDRGYLDTGMWADIIIVDPEKEWTVTKENIHYKCGWSPFEGHTFKGYVETTIVSGHVAYHAGVFDESKKGERMLFNR